MVTNTHDVRKTVVKYAHLGGVPGLAMCTPERRVFFRTEATAQWTELFDVDIPRLQLNGDVALVQAQAAVDGELLAFVARRNEEHPRQAA